MVALACNNSYLFLAQRGHKSVHSCRPRRRRARRPPHCRGVCLCRSGRHLGHHAQPQSLVPAHDLPPTPPVRQEPNINNSVNNKQQSCHIVVIQYMWVRKEHAHLPLLRAKAERRLLALQSTASNACTPCLPREAPEEAQLKSKRWSLSLIIKVRYNKY